MSVNVTLNGTIYSIPTSGDKPSTNWGTNVKNYLVALSTGVLSKAGGSFFLTSEVDFGPSYGIKSAWYSTRATSTATAGQIRFGNADVLSWRNAASNGNLDFGVNASDQLMFNGSVLQSSISVTDTATIDLTFTANSLSAIIIAASITNSHISTSAGIDFSKLATLASGNILVGSALNVATSVAVSGQATISDTGAITLDNAAVIAKVLTGWTPAAGTITASDSILSGMQKLQGNFASALTNPMSGFGDLIYGAASGVATRLAASTSGYILQTNGVGFAPSWVALSPATFTMTETNTAGDVSITSTYTGGAPVTYADMQVIGTKTFTAIANEQVLVDWWAVASSSSGGGNHISYGFSIDGATPVLIGTYFLNQNEEKIVGFAKVTAALSAGSRTIELLASRFTGANDLTIKGSNSFYGRNSYQVSRIGGSVAGGGAGSLTDGHIFVGNVSNVATDVALSGDISITNAGVSAIVAGVIVNADINASAAIARSKLAVGSFNHVLINDGSGVMTSEAALSATRGGTGVSNNVASTITITGAFPLALTLTASTALTLPISGTLLTTTAAQIVTLKDYDGGTATNTNRTTLAKNTTTNLAALTRKQGNIFYDTTLAQPVVDSGSALIPLATGATRTLYTTVFTGSGTWTKATLNPLYVKVTVIGGGGGGGGASSMSSVKSASEGAGGGGGGCSIRTIQAASLGATETVTIGAGGAAGNTSGTTGSAGGTSSFGTLATATGGAGGAAQAVGNGGTARSAGSVSIGGQGGIGASGDINLRGDDGGNGVIWVDYYTYGRSAAANYGGGSFMAGRRRSSPGGDTGSAGYTYGGGGSGGVGDVGTGRAGGAGAAGIVIVEEFA